jgi:hypothetical protein
MVRGTLEDDEIDEETGVLGKFQGDDMSYLSGILCERPNFGKRTKNEIDDKVDE